VVFTKLDLLGEDYVPPIETEGARGVFSVSAPGRLGLDPLLAAWWRDLLAMRRANEQKADQLALP
jgi:GTP-binding protein